MKRKLFLYVCFFLTQLYVVAQQSDAVAITINGTPVYKSELEKAYHKGIRDKEQEKKETVGEFVQSYIDYRLNIEEAKAQQLNTTPDYEREYYSYKVQLGNVYLKDTVILNSLIEKYYRRMLEDIDVNHVLIPFDKKEILPADTLALYNKAIGIRRQLVNNGFSGDGFVDNSVNPSIVMDITSINGHLGWITAFMLPLVLEDVAYHLPLGEVSMPIRTQKGYHLLQVVDKRPAVGAMNVDQVLFYFPNVPPAQHQIDSVGALVHRVSDGMSSDADFQALCDQFSLAYKTGDRGCSFGIVKLDTRVSPSFITAAFDLKNDGDISPPVMSDFGFHILRRQHILPVPSLSEAKNWMPETIKGSDRGKYHINEVCEYFKKEYNYSLNNDAFEKLVKLANLQNIEDKEFISAASEIDENLFVIDDKASYTVKDFLAFIEAEIALRTEEPDQLPSIRIIDNVTYNLSTDKLYDFLAMYSYSKLYAYAGSVLENRNPVFAQQLREYSEGILYFNVKNNNVWQKAQTDEKGLAKYFNKNKSKYKLEQPEFKGLVLHCRNEEVMKQAEEIYNASNGDVNNAFVKIRSELNAKATDVLIEKGTWEKGENANVDNKIFGENRTLESRRNFPYVAVVGKMISAPEDYTDVKAKVEADYQAQLELQWTKQLRKKYKVNINKSVINTIQ